MVSDRSGDGAGAGRVVTASSPKLAAGRRLGFPLWGLVYPSAMWFLGDVQGLAVDAMGLWQWQE